MEEHLTISCADCAHHFEDTGCIHVAGNGDPDTCVAWEDGSGLDELGTLMFPDCYIDERWNRRVV